MKLSGITVGNERIAAGCRCFIAAEVGINHNGDMQLAKRAIDAAVEAGADAVKFQNYVTSDFLDDERLTYTYVSQGEEVTESQWAMFKRCELSDVQVEELKAYCDAAGIVFFSTPTNAAGVDLLARIRAPLLKNGSDYLTNVDLIRRMAESGIPTVVSTGMATAGEIDDAVRAFREAGGEELVLLHCTSSYPTPPAEINLRRIPMLADTFGCPVGFSDHSEGVTAAIGAVVLGACFVEKHFTLDKTLPGPDHRFSCDPAELKTLVDAIRHVEDALGDSRLQPSPSEAVARQGFRLSCQAASDLPAGTQLVREHLAYKRPGSGIAPKLASAIVGLTVKRAVRRGHIFHWSDFHD